MKTQILNLLKQDYAHLGLDDTFLSGLADMLATSGLVTDENIEGVIANQKAYLESIQKSFDKRVQSAIDKTRKAAESTAEKTAEEHAAKVEALQKQIDSLTKPAPEPTPAPAEDNDIPEWYRKDKAEREKQLSQFQQTIQALQTAKEESDNKLKAIEEARASEEAMRAAQRRTETIGAKAKEKGIPDWMIRHGFADIPQDADESKINEILDGYAQEIKTNFLPNKGINAQFDGKTATKEEVGTILDKVLPQSKEK